MNAPPGQSWYRNTDSHYRRYQQEMRAWAQFVAARPSRQKVAALRGWHP